MKRILLTILMIGGALRAQESLLAVDQWKEAPRHDLRRAAADFDDSSWQRVRTSWPRSNLNLFVSGKGYDWYRATVTVPPELAGQPLAIGLAPLNEAYEVYVDGRFAGAQGHLQPEPAGTLFRYRAFRLVERAEAGQKLHLAIRRWRGGTYIAYRANFSLVSFAHEHAPELGPAALIEARQQNRELSCLALYLPNLVGNVVLVLAGILCLAMVRTGRMARNENLWLGLTLTATGLAPLIGLACHVAELSPREFWSVVAVSTLYVMTTGTALFLAAICPRLQIPLYAVAAMNAIFGLTRIPSLAWQFSIADAFGTLWTPRILLGATFATAAFLVWERRRGSHSLLLAAALLVPSALQLLFAQVGLQSVLGDRALAMTYLPFWGMYLDPRILANILFAALALLGLYLRHRGEQQRQAVIDLDLSAARHPRQDPRRIRDLHLPAIRTRRREHPHRQRRTPASTDRRHICGRRAGHPLGFDARRRIRGNRGPRRRSGDSAIRRRDRGRQRQGRTVRLRPRHPVWLDVRVRNRRSRPILGTERRHHRCHGRLA
jgi:hypothetical protein